MVTKSLWQRGSLGEVGVTRIAPRRDGLVLWLPLHRLQGDSIYSEEGRRQLYTVTGALWTPQGRSFDGSDDKILGDTVPTFPTRVTFEAWVNITGEGSHATYNYIIGVRNAYDQHQLYWNPTTLKAIGAIDFDDNSEKVATGATSLTLGVWYHLTLLYDGTFVRLYVNGVQDGISTSKVALLKTPTAAPSIGCQASAVPAYALFFKGKIGEVRIYNRALTGPEIQRIYLATKWRWT